MSGFQSESIESVMETVDITRYTAPSGEYFQLEVIWNWQRTKVVNRKVWHKAADQDYVTRSNLATLTSRVGIRF